jgi:4-hydroxy-3-polyprenylbenzoate decarboxylase
VDVKDLSSAFWRAVNHVDVTRDVIIDGNRVGIDATRKGSAKMVEMDVETDKLVKERWSEYGIEL